MELSAVRRCRHTTPQTTLPWKARALNIRHAFECDVDLTGKTVWVVDDVMTTGATLDELARILKLHGAKRVENRVVARALRHP
jgi:predicted amidophosphoribosyltransferase